MKSYSSYFVLILLFFHSSCYYYSYSFPRIVFIPSIHSLSDHHETALINSLQQQRKHYSILFSSQLLSSSSSSFNFPREQQPQQQEENLENHHNHLQQQQQQQQLRPNNNNNNNNNNNELPITLGVQLIIENQLQLLAAATKSINAELFLYVDNNNNNNNNQEASYTLTKFLSYSLTLPPPSPSSSSSLSSESSNDSKEILDDLLSIATDADTMIRMNGKNLAIPIYYKEYTYGYLFLQRGKSQRKGPRSIDWAKDPTAINYAQNTAVSLSHILTMESGGYEDPPSTSSPSSSSSSSSSHYIQSDPITTAFEMNKILLSFYPRLQEAKIGLKFIRTFTKNLQKRISDHDEMGKEMAENIFVQIEALKETVDGMEASLASIPEEIEGVDLYSEQGQPLLPMPNEHEFYEEEGEEEVEGDLDGSKVVAYQLMKL